MIFRSIKHNNSVSSPGFRAVILFLRKYRVVVLDASPLSRKTSAIMDLASKTDGSKNAFNDEGDLGEMTLNRSLDEFDILEESHINAETALLPKVRSIFLLRCYLYPS